jgi:membrane associated rhomboid family serine protease
LFPLRDENPTLLTPIITIALILINVVVWLYYQGGGMSQDLLANSICQFGAIPAEITGNTEYGGVELGPDVPPCIFGGLTWAAMLTSMFMHGSWLHLIGNMWFLWLFGNNVEDSMGHLRYLAYYIIGGLAGAAAHIWTDTGSMIPTVGASGAISAVMGGYLLLYPKVRIQTLFVLFIFIRIIPVPAWLVLGQYFALQLLYGTAVSSVGGGVAFWAHIGGFVAGALLVFPFRNPLLVEARKKHIRLSPYEINHRGWW